MPSPRPALLAVLLLGLASCGEGRTPAAAPPARAAAWREVAPDALSDAQRVQRAKADDARKALFGFLMARLQQELAAGGPAAAVAVCRTEAGRIAADVARSKGVAIGRTSFRLRNPANQPPEWAKPFVEAKREEPVVLAAADGRLAVLHPIRLMKACLACHGDPASFAPEVREALAKEYPSDRATGFRENDLRGWFWVEVPRPD